MRAYFLVLGFAVVLALLVRFFVLTAYRVPSSSMEPTLKAGDFIFSYRASYGGPIPFSSRRFFERLPERGDLVVFTYPSRPRIHFVKRVIGVPGDRIEMRGDHILLNGLPVREIAESGPGTDPETFNFVRERIDGREWSVWMNRAGTGRWGPIVVPPGEVFVLSDRRDSSDDSRNWGTVPVSHISGQAVLIWLSVARSSEGDGGLLSRLRMDRIFAPLY